MSVLCASACVSWPLRGKLWDVTLLKGEVRLAGPSNPELWPGLIRMQKNNHALAPCPPVGIQLAGPHWGGGEAWAVGCFFFLLFDASLPIASLIMASYKTLDARKTVNLLYIFRVKIHAWDGRTYVCVYVVVCVYSLCAYIGQRVIKQTAKASLLPGHAGCLALNYCQHCCTWHIRKYTHVAWFEKPSDDIWVWCAVAPLPPPPPPPSPPHPRMTHLHQ